MPLCAEGRAEGNTHRTINPRMEKEEVAELVGEMGESDAAEALAEVGLAVGAGVSPTLLERTR